MYRTALRQAYYNQLLALLLALSLITPSGAFAATVYLSPALGSFQAAYAGANSNDVFRSRPMTYFEGWLLNRNINLTLQGGYDQLSGTVTGFTAINGPLTVRLGSVVVGNLIIGGSNASVLVPNVVGQALTTAQASILAAGAMVGAVTPQYSATVPKDAVISQNPVAGTYVVSGSGVDLVVSLGAAVMVSVPNFVGQTQTAATSAITTAGLTVGTITAQRSDTVPGGTIISQSPLSGASVTSGTVVTLIVSSGPAGGSVTLLVYMEGTDLESGSGAAATKNINEMLNVTLPANVKVVLATGAAAKIDPNGPVTDWTKLRYYSINNKTLKMEKPDTIADMGDPAVLTDFIKWGQDNFTADRYVLIFWDHGGGALGGFGGNESKTYPTSVAKSMSVQQLRTAVATAVGRKFELIGFDACLMATVEVADAFKDVSKYLVASQDIEPGAGWDWTAFLKYLASSPSAGGGEIGKAIADSYKIKMLGESKQTAFTLSVLDLSKVATIYTALDEFSQWQLSLMNTKVVPDQLTAWFDLATARSGALDFNTSGFNAADNLEPVDIQGLISQYPFDPANNTKTKALLSSIKDAVYYKVWSDNRIDATGMNIMFPSVAVWDNTRITNYSNMTFVKSYQDLVTSYSNFARSASFPAFTIAAPAPNPDDANTFTAEVTVTDNIPMRYEQAYIAQTWLSTDGATILEGLQPLLPVPPVIYLNPLTYSWTGKWICLGNTEADAVAVAMIATRNLRSMPDGTSREILTYKIPIYLNNTNATYFIENDLSKAESDATKYTHLGYQDSNTLFNQAYPFYALGKDEIVNTRALSITAEEPLGSWVVLSNVSLKVGALGQNGLKLFSKQIVRSEANLRFLLYDLRWKPYYSDKF